MLEHFSGNIFKCRFQRKQGTTKRSSSSVCLCFSQYKSHPKRLTTCPYSHFLRLRRICSEENDFETQKKKNDNIFPKPWLSTKCGSASEKTSIRLSLVTLLLQSDRMWPVLNLTSLWCWLTILRTQCSKTSSLETSTCCEMTQTLKTFYRPLLGLSAS